jgi:hypothetical protein
MSRALPGQCQGDVAAIAEHEPVSAAPPHGTRKRAETSALARRRRCMRRAVPALLSLPTVFACAFGFSAYGPTPPPAAGPLRPGWRRAARRCGGAPICQAGACGDGGSAESPTTRLTRQRRRPHRDCAGPSSLSPRRCPIRPRRRWPPSARADKSSVAPDDQARAPQMGRIAALGATRRRTAHTLS